MNGTPLRLLLVEDNAGDARLVRESLRAEREVFELEHTTRLSDALRRLEAGRLDAVLLDLGLPDSHGWETFAAVRGRSPETAIVLLTGSNDAELALRALQHGAQDYVVKGMLKEGWLPRAVRYAVERKRAEGLSRSNTELERFALVASHDLQEPLNKVRSYGEMLTRLHAAELSPSGRDLLGRMVSSAERMSVLVADVLGLARVAQSAGAFGPVDLNDAVRQALEDLEMLVAEADPAALEVGRLPEVWAQASQMRQLFRSLIGNALKFRRPGVPPRIAVTGHPLTGGMAEVRVSDDGVGFGAAQAARLFLPFTRLEGRAGPPGSGMGLAICRAVAMRHGGWITARSEPGRGATFAVALPLRRPA